MYKPLVNNRHMAETRVPRMW